MMIVHFFFLLLVDDFRKQTDRQLTINTKIQPVSVDTDWI